MRVSPRPADVRQLVQRVFKHLGVDQARLARIEETVLLDRGRYVARSYRTSGYLASWLIEVGILQFYDAEGNMLQTVNLLEQSGPQKMVA